ILALDVIRDVASHVCARAEAASDAREDNDSDVWIIVPSPHVFPHFRDRGVLFGSPDEGIHALRPIEFDPQDATVFGLVQQIIDKFRSHGLPPYADLCEVMSAIHMAGSGPDGRSITSGRQTVKARVDLDTP